MPDILYEVADHIATITLHRPERRNALTEPMLDLLSEVVLQADADPEVRSIVLTGSGEGFCAGLDLIEAAGQTQCLDELAFSFAAERAPVVVLHEIDTPVVAGVNGSAAGYGIGIALNADIRVMERSARLVSATKRGLVPESGDTYLLHRLIGWEAASRFYFLGQDLTGQQALAAGVVSEVADGPDAVRERAAELAAQVAALPPLAVQAAKRMMRAALDDGYRDHVERVLLQLLPLFRTADFAEAVAAFLQKRPPEFTGR